MPIFVLFGAPFSCSSMFRIVEKPMEICHKSGTFGCWHSLPFADNSEIMGAFRNLFAKVAPIMALTDTAISKEKPGPKPIKLFDERGLFARPAFGRKTLASEVQVSRQREEARTRYLSGHFPQDSAGASRRSANRFGQRLRSCKRESDAEGSG